MPDSKVEKKTRGKKLAPESTHRKKWLETLDENQKPIAELFLKGEKAKPTPLAKELQKTYRLMEWRDRSEAAIKDIEKIRLSDLRKILASSEEFIKHEDVLELAGEIRVKLMERLEKEYEDWLEDLDTLINEGRIIRALNLSSRPPKAGKPLPTELANRLVISANTILTDEDDISQKRSASLLTAVAHSPIAQRISTANLEPIKKLTRN